MTDTFQPVAALSGRSMTAPTNLTTPGREAFQSATPAATNPSGLTAAQQSAKAVITGFLGNYGLQGLASQAWTWFLGGMPVEQIMLQIQQTPEFTQRFPAIAMRQKAGLPPLTPQEYVDYEKQATQMMHMAGMPQGFYDKPGAFTDLLAGDVSLSELQDRVLKGFAAVSSAAPEVRAAFNSYFGPGGGDGALASYFLDPSKSEEVLTQQVAAAQMGGRATDFGINVGVSTAMEMAKLGISPDQAQAGFKNLQGEQALFTQSAGEREAGASQVTQQQGLQAEFGLAGGGQAQLALQKEQEGRQAEMAGGGGAFQSAKTGNFGLGSGDQS